MAAMPWPPGEAGVREAADITWFAGKMSDDTFEYVANKVVGDSGEGHLHPAAGA